MNNFALMYWNKISVNIIVISILSFSCDGESKDMARIIGGSDADFEKWNYVVAIYKK